MNVERENIKISFSEPIFNVNEKKKTVSCVLNYRVNTPFRRDIYEHVAAPSFDATSVGIARCNKDDKFDVTIGKKIAACRAENNAYKFTKNKINREWMNIYQLFNNAVRNFSEKCNKVITHNNTYSEDICK